MSYYLKGGIKEDVNNPAHDLSIPPLYTLRETELEPVAATRFGTAANWHGESKSFGVEVDARGQI